ncbi:MAG: transglycosylase SLT domain-containing protein [Pseudohongiella sp.]|nr:transglycosylase SLT domain-containing protein [Pseudohongiella sp.]
MDLTVVFWRNLTAIAVTSTFLCLPTITDAQNTSRDLAAQREIYAQAREAQARGRTSELQVLSAQLTDYPLLPYLEFQSLRPRLISLAASRADASDVDAFLQRYPDSLLGNRLEREWVAALAEQSRWADVLRYYRPQNTNATLTCHALRARIEIGDKSGLEAVEPLWNVNYSQPNDCDPVFEAWRAEGFLSPDIAWQRFSKTMQVRQLSLARYISRLMPERERALSEIFLRIDSQPERLLSDAALNRTDPEIKEIILHGVRRLAPVDAVMAMTALEKHSSNHSFSREELVAARQFIAQRKLLQGFVAETEDLLSSNTDLSSETLVGWILRDALRQQNWQRMAAWLPRLPEEAKNTERWRYWQARTLEQLHAAGVDHNEALEEAQSIYYELAQTRSFYGFLSADKLGLPYELVDRPVPVSEEDINGLYNNPSIVRAYELYMTGDEVSARSEWQFATASMTPEQVISSGRLADSWGWHRNGIQAMIRAGYWDDLQLRFPLAYSDLFANAAREHDVSTHLLFAVARQESAFMHDVRSSAGALGLMQLMPATGRETARALGLRVTDQDLLHPETNIRIGSRYLTQLLSDFNGNRALAAAAYNAGPNRVRQWLRQTGANPIPLDAWIETIPFAETRTYVQNVLAFSVIYGYRMELPIAFLTDEEASSYW